MKMIKNIFKFNYFIHLLAFFAIQSSSLEVEKFVDDYDRPIPPHQKWPKGIDNLYYIPFVYSTEIRENVHLQHQIQKAISMLQQNTCIHLEYLANSYNIADGKDYIEFFMGTRCQTMIGHSKGMNLIELGEKCEMAPAILNLICLKIGLNKEETPFKVENINKIYPCKRANKMGEEEEEEIWRKAIKKNDAPIQKNIVKQNMNYDDGGKYFGIFGPPNENFLNKKLFEAVEEMEEAVEEMEDEEFYIDKLEKKEEKMAQQKNEENLIDEVDWQRKNLVAKNKRNEGENGVRKNQPTKMESIKNEKISEVNRNKHEKNANKTTVKNKGNDIKSNNLYSEPFILIGFVIYVFLASAFIGKILVKCCGQNSNQTNQPNGASGRRKSSLGRRLRHFSWDANSFGAQQKEREEPREQSQSRPQSRPQSPIPTISNGDLRRISVVNFQLPSSGKEYLTVPIYERIS